MISSFLSWFFLPRNYLLMWNPFYTTWVNRQRGQMLHYLCFHLIWSSFLNPTLSEKITRGLSFQRCGQTRWGWAPLLDSGKPYSLPCCHCPAPGASGSVQTQCRCSGWSFGCCLCAPKLCRETGQTGRKALISFKIKTKLENKNNTNDSG